MALATARCVAQSVFMVSGLWYGIEHLCVEIISNYLSSTHLGQGNRNVCFSQTMKPVCMLLITKLHERPTSQRFCIPWCWNGYKCFNINFVARHIPGQFNVLAEHLSRSQVEELRELAPCVNSSPV